MYLIWPDQGVAIEIQNDWASSILHVTLFYLISVAGIQQSETLSTIQVTLIWGNHASVNQDRCDPTILSLFFRNSFQLIYQPQSNGFDLLPVSLEICDVNTSFLIKQFLFRKNNKDNNNKRETLRHKIFGYNDNISTMVKGEKYIYFPSKVVMFSVLAIACRWSADKTINYWHNCCYEFLQHSILALSPSIVIYIYFVFTVNLAARHTKCSSKDIMELNLAFTLLHHTSGPG